MIAARRRESGVDVVAMLRGGLFVAAGRRWDEKRLWRKRKTVLISGVCSQYSLSSSGVVGAGSSSMPQRAACVESAAEFCAGTDASCRVGLNSKDAAAFVVGVEGLGCDLDDVGTVIGIPA